MATGANLQPGRSNQVSDLPPATEVRTGEAEMWQSAGRLADQLVDVAKEDQTQRAILAGKQEGADRAAAEASNRENGLPPLEAPRQSLLAFGDVHAAREQAASRAYLTGIRSDLDARESEVRNKFGYDVQGYEREMTNVRSAFVQNAQPEYAVDVENYAHARIGAGKSAVADAASNVRLQKDAQNIAQRSTSLAARLVGMLRDGKSQTVEFKLMKDELDQNQLARLENPAIAYSQAAYDADAREFLISSTSAIHVNDAVQTLHAEGPTAALTKLQEILVDPDLDAATRQPVFEAARAALNQEIDLAQDKANITIAARTRAESEMKKRIEDDAAAIEIGAPSTGLAEAEVMAVQGPSGVAEWRKAQAEASQRNRLTGSLVGLPRDEAIKRAMQALPGAEGSISDLNDPLKTPADFEAFAAAIRQVETGGNPARRSEAGAVGAMQLLPDTARDMARLEGIPYDENRLLNDPEYNSRLGKRYLSGLLDKYDGNQMLAATAYHAGPGLTDAWLKPKGVLTPVVLGGRTVQAAGRGDPRTGEVSTADWLDSISQGNPRSAAYPRSVAQALGGGRQSAEWRSTQAATIVTNATQGFTSDPLNFAASHRMAALPPLSVDGVFQGGEAAQTWGQSLRARQALGSELARTRGAPQRFLTNGEVSAFKDRIERSPGDAITIARTATQAIGGRGARDLLAEIGQGDSASTAIHIADIAATGGDSRFADAASNGLNLKASGTEMSKDKRDDVAAEINRWQSLFGRTPALLAAVRNSAMAAALSDETNGVVRPPEYYAQAALGRTRYGQNQFGGAAEVNGVSVVLPRWMNADRFDDALNALSDRWATSGAGPVFGNGDPMPARTLSRLRPVLQSNGNYRLQDDRGAVAVKRDGSAFEVDMDAARALLQQRLGSGSVRPD